MTLDINKIVQRINFLSAVGNSKKTSDLDDDSFMAEIETSTKGILEILYGAGRKRWEDYIQSEAPQNYAYDTRLKVYLGVLSAIRSEIEMGLTGNLRREIEGEVFADFVTLAKRSLEENKDVAAVLASSALEDALKRLGIQNGLDVENKDMSEVINALKTKGLIKGAQGKILSSYIQLRNKAFHAEWNNIEKPEISSMIGFTEQFLAKHFS
jgi:hypothetical protein